MTLSPARNTIDLAICATEQPTAAAASVALCVPAGNSAMLSSCPEASSACRTLPTISITSPFLFDGFVKLRPNALSGVIGGAQKCPDGRRGNVGINARAEHRSAICCAAFDIGCCLRVRTVTDGMFLVVRNVQQWTVRFFERGDDPEDQAIASPRERADLTVNGDAGLRTAADPADHSPRNPRARTDRSYAADSSSQNTAKCRQRRVRVRYRRPASAHER